MSNRSDRRTPQELSQLIYNGRPGAGSPARVPDHDRVVLENTAALFSAMGDPTRLRLLQTLAAAEMCVGDLAVYAGISQSGVSHQLGLLRALGLVVCRRDGNRALYRLADDHVRTLLAQGFEHAAEKGGPAA